MAKVSLSSPWILFYKKVSALFEKDPGVRVLFDESDNSLKLFVEDAKKATALEKLLPKEMTFGSPSRTSQRMNGLQANQSSGCCSKPAWT